MLEDLASPCSAARRTDWISCAHDSFRASFARLERCTLTKLSSLLACAETHARKTLFSALPAPVSLVRAVREQHMLTHLPCHPWCSACVEGRGRDDPHQRRAHKDDDVPAVISVDYGFGRDETGEDDTERTARLARCQNMYRVRALSLGYASTGFAKRMASWFRLAGFMEAENVDGDFSMIERFRDVLFSFFSFTRASCCREICDLDENFADRTRPKRLRTLRRVRRARVDQHCQSIPDWRYQSIILPGSLRTWREHPALSHCSSSPFSSSCSRIRRCQDPS